MQVGQYRHLDIAVSSEVFDVTLRFVHALCG